MRSLFSRSLGFLPGFAIAAAIAACGGSATHSPGAQSSTASANSDAASSGASALAPVDGPEASSTVALARVSGKLVAFVADADAKAIVAIDVDAKKELRSTKLAGTPASLLITKDGRVLVTLRDTNALVALALSSSDGALVQQSAIALASEPLSIALTPDEKIAVVTSGFGHTLSLVDLKSQKLVRTIDVAREPRSVVIADDGATAFVAHAVGGTVSAVDLRGTAPLRALAMQGLSQEEAALRQRSKMLDPTAPFGLMERKHKGRIIGEEHACQGFALAKSIAPSDRILAPQVMAQPGNIEQRPAGYGDGNRESEQPDIAVIDARSGEPQRDLVSTEAEVGWQRKTARDHRDACLLPRAAAFERSSGSLLVACMGTDQLIAYDASSLTPERAERARYRVATGPSGIAIDEATHRAFVWASFDRALSIVSLASPVLDPSPEAPIDGVMLADLPKSEALSEKYVLGRVLFHASSDPRIAQDGRACASCHPDGRDDGLTWATPNGPRRSVILAGRITGTAPYAWNGGGATLTDHVGHTFDRLDGQGLRGIELAALLEYIEHMPVPAAIHSENQAQIARGDVIFHSKEAACSSCHAGDHFTDGAMHDVKSGVAADAAPTFNTPSLHLIGGAGPYFHDGRYSTLHDLLRATDGTMGHTKQLSDPDLTALETYVSSL